ncbi:MAG: hypothetical protein HY657_17835 [Acidobacteria bacterium]|nr:hypothetical protein [Acidobacteriota bacterium]
MLRADLARADAVLIAPPTEIGDESNPFECCGAAVPLILQVFRVGREMRPEWTYL